MKRGEPLAALLAQLRAAEKTGDLASPALAWSAVQQGALAWREGKGASSPALGAAMSAADAIRELVIAGDVEALRALDARARKALAARRERTASDDGAVLVAMVGPMREQNLGAPPEEHARIAREIADRIAAKCSTLPSLRHRFDARDGYVTPAQEAAAAKVVERYLFKLDKRAPAIVRHALVALGYSASLAKTAAGIRRPKRPARVR